MSDADTLQQMVLRLAQDSQRRYYGKFRGIVTQNNDPENQGRIRAKVPELFNDEEIGWAMACLPFAPPNCGFLALPEVNSNVWIEFEGGDPSRPIWVGCFHGQGKGLQLASPAVKTYQTAAGNKVVLDDTSGSEKVTLQDKNGAEVTLAQQGITLKKGGMKVEVTDSQVSVNDGALTVM